MDFQIGMQIVRSCIEYKASNLFYLETTAYSYSTSTDALCRLMEHI